MTLHEVKIEGTLQSDGTLRLDAKPNLSPGRVTGVLRQQPEPLPPPQEDWFEFMQKARKRMEQAGCHFMDEKEIQEHVAWLREEDRIDELLREAGQQRQKLEP